MRLLSERSWAKMATGSDLLRDVFEADGKVVSSSDVSGSPAAGHINTAVREPCSEKHNSAGDKHSNVPASKMGLSQQELAKAGTGAPQVVLNSAETHGSSMDGAAGTRTTSPVGPSVTAAAPSQPTAAAAASGVVAVVTEAGKPGSTGGVKTLNGSTVVVNCHVPDSSSQQVTLVNNGPVTVSKAVPAAPTTIIRTSSPLISSQSSVKSVPTVTLVRAPMQTPTNALHSGGNPGTAVSAPAVVTAGVAINKQDSMKTAVQTGAHILASTAVTGTSATTRSPTVLQTLRTTVPSTPAAGVRVIAPQVLAPRLPQPQQNAPNIQNIQLPPGMVLIRSESGQLLMIHQQALAQMQAQSQSQSAMTPRPAAPTSAPPVQIASLQAPGASLLTRSVAPTTIIKQGSAAQTTVTPTITKLQRPPVLQNTIVLGGNAATSSPQLGTSTVTTVQPGSAATTVAQRVMTAVKPGTCVAPTPVSAETLENVKKCRNFLSTLIKLASSGKQSTETTASVKDLVKSLLVGKIEPEDFTSRLYKELNSSPQPYLVPFLKRSLPSLRQMTPDPDTFIQQSLLPQPSMQSTAASSAALTAVMLRPPPSTAATVATSTTTTKPTVISLTQTPHSKPALIVPQQQGTILRPQVTVTQSPMVTLRGQPQSRIILGQPQVVKQLQTAVKQSLVPGARGVQVVSQTSLSAAQVKLREAGGGGSFRDDDDINDVASMAGVNLSEESARIMATNSDLVGAVTRSCKDEAFLSASSLTLRALEIGKKFGVGELGSDVINLISHATQQRLQNLLEKVTHVAQQKNVNFKDERHEQVSDVRTQLRFFEQLDQMEKQRKDEAEREILLKAAKSRSRQEDPEQLRLKQKAKEMQQQELAQIRQREANLTALAAIGPRKKRKMNSPVRGASAEGSGSGPCQPTGSSGSGHRQFMRQRITRVNLRDLLLCLENERESSHSHLLYKGFLK